MLSGFANCLPSCSDEVPYSCRPEEWEGSDESMAELGHDATLARCDVGDTCQNTDLATCINLEGVWHFGAICPEAGCQDP